VVSLYESDYSLYEGNTNGQSITVTPGEFNTYNNVNSSIKFVGAEYPAEDDYFVGWRILVEKQFRNIIDYDGTTKTEFLNRKFEENINQTNILTKNLYSVQDAGKKMSRKKTKRKSKSKSKRDLPEAMKAFQKIVAHMATVFGRSPSLLRLVKVVRNEVIKLNPNLLPQDIANKTIEHFDKNIDKFKKEFEKIKSEPSKSNSKK
jgi:hypothetical protein